MIIPPSSVASPAREKVEEAERWSDICRGPEMVEEAEEIKPAKVESPVTERVSANVATPPIVIVDEAEKLSETWKGPEMVEEALEIYPLLRIVNPPTVIVEEALR